MKYQAKPVPVQAIQLDIALTYEKWSETQHSEVGDWLLSKNGETYTCPAATFAETYRLLPGHEGWFYKHAEVDVEIATESGSVVTSEGQTAYVAGDYIVTNPDGSRHAIEAARFGDLYEPLTTVEKPTQPAKPASLSDGIKGFFKAPGA